MPTYILFSSVVFAGAGGTANLFFSFYIRDKGWGMGALMPKVVNPLRAQEEVVSERAFQIAETESNLAHWRVWFRHLSVDQILFFWLLNTFTILLFIFGALAVLHPQGIVPSQEMLVWEEAEILGSVGGGLGKMLFLLVGIACLFSTQLTLIDGVARTGADILHTNYAWAQEKPLSWWYGVIAVGWIVLGTFLTYVYESLPPILFLMGSAFFWRDCNGCLYAVDAGNQSQAAPAGAPTRPGENCSPRWNQLFLCCFLPSFRLFGLDSISCKKGHR